MSDNVLSFAILDQLSGRFLGMSISDIVAYTVKQTLKQVAHDYDLSYKELKVAYLEPGASGAARPQAASDVNIRDNLPEAPEAEVEAEPTPEPTPKPKAKSKAKAKKSPEPVKAAEKPKSKAPEPVKVKAPEAGPVKTALSKMKKDECISECRRLGLSTDGTVPQLRERIREALKGGGAPPVSSGPDAPKATPPPKKGGGSKKKKSKEAKPAHSHALTEEVVDGCEVCETHGNVLAEETEDEYREDREDGEELTLAERLKRLLAAHGDAGEDEDIGEDGDPDYEPGELLDYDETQLVE